VSRSDSQVVRLIAEARAGSRNALGEAMESCRAYLLMVAAGEMDPALGAKAGPSDIVQQTFLEAQCGFDHFTGTTEAELLGWLRKILVNNVINFARSYRGTSKRDVDREVALVTGEDWNDQRIGAPADSGTPSRAAIENERTAALEEAIEKLPADYRTVINLRYREQRSFEEIARLMNRTANAAAKLWARAIEKLEQELKQ
jgi:RNA polymerase sigma-70 factor (ECF subfamily)